MGQPRVEDQFLPFGQQHNLPQALPNFRLTRTWRDQQVALRYRIVLAAANGQSDLAVARQYSINRKTVMLWRQRFTELRLDGLWEIAPGRGCKPTYPDQEDRGDCGGHLAHPAGRHDALELPNAGQEPGGEQVHHQHHLAGSHSETPSGGNLQAVP